jgi:hypothetical protein
MSIYQEALVPAMEAHRDRPQVGEPDPLQVPWAHDDPIATDVDVLSTAREFKVAGVVGAPWMIRRVTEHARLARPGS